MGSHSAAQLLHRNRAERRPSHAQRGPSSVNSIAIPPFTVSLSVAQVTGKEAQSPTPTVTGKEAKAPVPKPKAWNAVGGRVKAQIDDADDAQAEIQAATARMHKTAARALWERPEGGGRRTRLVEAEEEVTMSIRESPGLNPALFEFRSLVRATQRDFDLALDDADRAKRVSEAIRTETLLREARALSGLGRLPEAGASFIRALDHSPGNEVITNGFDRLLHTVQRNRYYWSPRRLNMEKLVDAGDNKSALLKPSAPLNLKVVKEPGEWIVAFTEPLEDGGDEENLHYELSISAENPLNPSGPWFMPRVIGRCRENPFRFSVSSLRTLPPSTKIELYLRARTSVGEGPPCICKGMTTPPLPKRVLQARPIPEDWGAIDVSDLMKDAEKRTEVPPAKQFEALYEVWARQDYAAIMKAIFRFYCVNGSRRDKMTSDAFMTLAKNLGLLSKEFTKTELSIIFVRANINKVDKVQANDTSDNLLELAEFVCALTRVAALKYAALEKEGGVAAQMDRLLSINCKPQFDSIVNDPLSATLDTRDVHVVFYRHRPRLSVIFGAYCMENDGSGAISACLTSKEKMNVISSAAAEWGLSRTGVLGTTTLSCEAWIKMAKEGHMISVDFTQREATEIFMRVNLIDELFAVESPSEDEKTASMDEFELMVARLAHEKVVDAAGPFASTLDAFLTLIFVPTYRKILKARGYTVPVTDDVKLTLDSVEPTTG